MTKRYSTIDIKKAKATNQKITMITAYDRLTASIAENAGCEILLVGDSLGMVVLGYHDTIQVTMDDMVRHTRAVSNSTNRAMVLADMPFLSCHVSVSEAIKNAGRLMAEGGAGAVKIEGGVELMPTVKAIVQAGIPVVGHVGYTPQSINVFGGHKAQGKTLDTAIKTMEDALAFQVAGACAVVLECVPYRISELITKKLQIPTVGIGSGPECDGQVLVIHDLLGLNGGFKAKHFKTYINGEELLTNAAKQYVSEVKEVVFPTNENSFLAEEEAVKEVKRLFEV